MNWPKEHHPVRVDQRMKTIETQLDSEAGTRIQRSRQLLLLAVAMAAGGYVRTTISPLQETMRAALSMSDNQMALLQGPAIGIPMIIAAVPLGLIIDRSSRARLLLVLISLSFLGSILTAFSSGFALLLLSRGLAGLMGLSTIPVVYSLLSDLYAPAQRGRATTVVCVGQLGGISAAFFLGGLLLTINGAGPEGWRWAMLWLTVPLIPVGLLMLALSEPPRTGTTTKGNSAKQLWVELRHYRGILASLVLGVVLIETAVGAILIWAAPMLSRSFGLPPDRIGSVVAMTTFVGGILGPVLGGTIADMCQRIGGPRRTVSVLSGLALLSAPLGLFAFVSGVLQASIVLVVAMTFLQTIAVTGLTLFTIVIPNELRGLCMSAFVAVNLLFVFAVAPVCVSLLSGAIGGSVMIGRALSIVCVVANILAAVAFAFGRRFLTGARALDETRVRSSA